MSMSVADFKIWMIRNGYKQHEVAKALGITSETITNYNNNGRYPVMFQLAVERLSSLDKTTHLKGLEK